MINYSANSIITSNTNSGYQWELHGKWQQFVWGYAMNYWPRSRWHLYRVDSTKPSRDFLLCG